MGAKRSLKSNAVALAEVCKANDERTFARMRGNDVDAPIPAITVTSIGRLNSTDPEQPFQVDAPFAPAEPVLEQTRRKIGSCYVLNAVASGRFVRNGGRPS